MARKTATRAKVASGFKETFETKTWVAASLNLIGGKGMTDDEEIDLSYQVESLSINKNGSLLAECRCGDTAFVCAEDDISALAAFLNKIVAAQNEAKSAKK